jgi:hypothetical protein
VGKLAADDGCEAMLWREDPKGIVAFFDAIKQHPHPGKRSEVPGLPSVEWRRGGGVYLVVPGHVSEAAELDVVVAVKEMFMVQVSVIEAALFKPARDADNFLEPAMLKV